MLDRFGNEGSIPEAGWKQSVPHWRAGASCQLRGSANPLVDPGTIVAPVPPTGPRHPVAVLEEGSPTLTDPCWL